MVTLTAESFGKLDGKEVKKFTWRTSTGFTVTAISYGAIIQSIQSPDKYGVSKDLSLGFDDLESYVKRNVPYLGAPLGRCANRIGGATFDIDGVTYQLAKNQGNNNLHGGLVGFHMVLWDTTIDGEKVIFSYLSKDLEEGYPGDVITNITYQVTEDDILHMDFKALTTKKTVVNLSNHAYFNLAGHDAGPEELYNHVVAINADRVTETYPDQVPTGAFWKVGGSPFDLRTPKRLGDAMKTNILKHQDKLFDNNFCVANYNGDIKFVSRVTHPPSGRYLEVYSDQPGVQFYTSNNLPYPNEPALVGKNNAHYRRHGAFCLETQKFPDAVHHSNFPRVVVNPGEVYSHRVQYRFGIEKSDDPAVVPA